MDSLKTIGKVEPLEANGHMHWAQAGVTLFTFAAPSAVMSVPFAIANAGFLGGMAICVVITCASVAGADMLLQIKLQHPECGNFGDLGLKIYGRPGQIFGNLIQLGNFCLFMPCALRFCAESLQGIGILGLSCTDYYVWIVALFCLLTTQVRTLSNAQVFTLFSAGCVVGMVVCMLVAAFQYEVAEKVPAQWVGNPAEDPALLLVRFASGCSISAWAYVPAFLTVELSTCMKSPADFRKSLVFAAGLNVMIFLVVGTCVAARWGFAVGEVITITVGVGAWVQGTVVNTLFSIFQLGGNFVSYMLDSVPLCRHCQQSWDPNFQDTWSAADMLRYLGHTLPTFILALVLATFTPSVGTLLDFVTALTTPWVSQIYPAMLFWEVLRQRGSVDTGAKRGLLAERAVTLCVLLVGVLSFALCSMKAVGYLAIEELRPDFHVGCSGW